jgi:general secretion pathway protein A
MSQLPLIGPSGQSFAIAPDPRHFYQINSHGTLWRMLRAALAKRAGFIVVIGEAGMGKTLLIQRTQTLLPEHREMVLIKRSDQNAMPFLRALTLLVSLPDTVSRLPNRHLTLDDLFAVLEERAKAERGVLVAVDHAQRLSKQNLEYLYQAVRFGGQGFRPVQIMLVGRPELEELLALPSSQEISQEIVDRGRLTPLSPIEMWRYVHFNLLKMPGAPVRLSFTGWWAVLRYGQGNPSRINRVMRLSMAAVAGQKKRVIRGGGVRRALRAAGESGTGGWLPGLASPWGQSVLMAGMALAVFGLGWWQGSGPRPEVVADMPTASEPLPESAPTQMAALTSNTWASRLFGTDPPSQETPVTETETPAAVYQPPIQSGTSSGGLTPGLRSGASTPELSVPPSFGSTLSLSSEQVPTPEDGAPFASARPAPLSRTSFSDAGSGLPEGYSEPVLSPFTRQPAQRPPLETEQLDSPRYPVQPRTEPTRSTVAVMPPPRPRATPRRRPDTVVAVVPRTMALPTPTFPPPAPTLSPPPRTTPVPQSTATVPEPPTASTSRSDSVVDGVPLSQLIPRQTAHLYKTEDQESSPFVVQISSVNKTENAERMVEKLQKMGYKPYIRVERRDDKTWYAVRLEAPGWDQAYNLADEIEAREKMPVLVINRRRR